MDDATLVRRGLLWIDAQLAAAGVERTGPAAQVRSWGLSNILRIPTADGNVYFKALARSSTIRPARVDALPLLFAHEPLLLQKLSDEHPDAVPAPLAVDEQRVWMLLPDLGPRWPTSRTSRSGWTLSGVMHGSCAAMRISRIGCWGSAVSTVDSAY
ncbi:hypothetical protein [Kribbella sp. CA-294648]|uniref:hypothetical protein n=1 Tax=Kribbella sp. CA-294648 TaxID=3239948 RepID=UPI003D8C19A3